MQNFGALFDKRVVASVKARMIQGGFAFHHTKDISFYRGANHYHCERLESSDNRCILRGLRWERELLKELKS